MNRTKNLKGVCNHCGAGFEFPVESIGLAGRCPHCLEPTELCLAPPPVEAGISRKLILWTLVALVILALGVIAPLVGLRLYQKRWAERQRGQSAPSIPASPAKSGTQR
jgi:hypothetical protein